MKRFLLAILAVVSLTMPANSATLRVAPVSLEVTNGAVASTVRIWNDDREPLHVQVRIFRSIERGGQTVLEPTQDVVASPPITSLQPGSENIIRVVRVSSQPLQGRETYRLIIDELPDPSAQKAGTVSILVRHAIPVTFQ